MSGSPQGVTTATDVLSVRGRLVVVAIHPNPREVNLFQVFWRELTLIGARVYQREDFTRAVEIIGSGAVPVAELISRVVPIRQVTEAFAALERGGVVKVLVDCASVSDDDA